jgi:hypothetical protein
LKVLTASCSIYVQNSLMITLNIELSDERKKSSISNTTNEKKLNYESIVCFKSQSINNQEASHIDDSLSSLKNIKTTQAKNTGDSLFNKGNKRRNAAYYINSTQEIIKRLGSKNRKTIKRDRKVSRSLGLLIFSFFICWFPYTLLSLINAICLKQTQNPIYCINTNLLDISFYLLWIKSAVNTFIYTMYQNAFRVAYKNIFVTKKRRR